MKRQILQGMMIMLLCFFVGGIYIIHAIRQATGDLEHAVALHQVGDFATELRYGLEQLQTDLTLIDTPFSRSPERIHAQFIHLREQINNVRTSRMVRDPDVVTQIGGLLQQTEHYIAAIEQMVNQPGGSPGYHEFKAHALKLGEDLIGTAMPVALSAGGQLTGQSETIYRRITGVSHLISFLVVVGPVAVLIFTAYFFKRFTGSVEVLVEASKVLGEGNLDYRIDTGNTLKYEFKQLADAFNGMSESLKKEQDELQGVRRLYQTLFESAGEGIFILSLDEQRKGDIISANQAAAAMHGYSVDELLTMNIDDLTCDGNCVYRLEEAQSGSWNQYTIERSRKDGTTFQAEVSLGLLDMGEYRYALAFSRDITRRKKEEAELQRANQMALVGEMAAGLAHEIKNPLAGIKVSLEVLADELPLNEDDKELFNRVIHETHRMEKLLKGLLSYARPARMQYERFDLNALLDNVIQSLAATGRSASGQKVQFIRQLAADLPQLEADSAKLQQIVLNILLNAIDAMVEGGDITVATRRHDENSLEIRIADTGKGISDSELTTVFQPFYTTKAKGTGLGLAICKRIIEEHGGTIEASGNEAGGATFTLLLPLTQTRRDR